MVTTALFAVPSRVFAAIQTQFTWVIKQTLQLLARPIPLPFGGNFAGNVVVRLAKEIRSRCGTIILEGRHRSIPFRNNYPLEIVIGSVSGRHLQRIQTFPIISRVWKDLVVAKSLFQNVGRFLKIFQLLLS